MRLIGFNFDKISVERFKDRVSNLKINTNIDVSEINPVKADILKTKEEILQANFSYTVKYEPGFAEINIKGKALLSVEGKLAKEILKKWKNKEISDEFKSFLFNIILRKSSLKSLQLEEDLNLPLHIALPTLRLSKENKEK
jgi:hypothetical protein